VGYRPKKHCAKANSGAKENLRAAVVAIELSFDLMHFDLLLRFDLLLSINVNDKVMEPCCHFNDVGIGFNTILKLLSKDPPFGHSCWMSISMSSIHIYTCV
jgi:hypothetical protein